MKIKILTAIFLSGVLLTTFIEEKRIAKLKKENSELNLKVKEMSEIIEKQQIEIAKQNERLAEYYKKISKKNKFEIIKEKIIIEKRREDLDECGNIKNLLDEYRNSELQLLNDSKTNSDSGDM
ncbi:MAG: hypothetical protein QXW35_05100 [Candidatus Aenigmatarchaeota archaeon]